MFGFICLAHDFHKESIYFCPTENCYTGQMCFPDVPMQLQYIEFSGLTLKRKKKHKKRKKKKKKKKNKKNRKSKKRLKKLND